LTVNLMKSKFCHAKVTFLGHIVQIATVSAKIEAIIRSSVPDLKRLLGMAGYYWKFCHHFSSIAKPLTALLKAGVNDRQVSSCYF